MMGCKNCDGPAISQHCMRFRGEVSGGCALRKLQPSFLNATQYLQYLQIMYFKCVLCLTLFLALARARALSPARSHTHLLKIFRHAIATIHPYVCVCCWCEAF